VYFNVNFNILKQIGCALVGLIKDRLFSSNLVTCAVIKAKLDLLMQYLFLRLHPSEFLHQSYTNCVVSVMKCSKTSLITSRFSL